MSEEIFKSDICHGPVVHWHGPEVHRQILLLKISSDIVPPCICCFSANNCKYLPYVLASVQIGDIFSTVP